MGNDPTLKVVRNNSSRSIFDAKEEQKQNERKLDFIQKKDRSLSVAPKWSNDRVSNVRRNLMGLEFNIKKKRDCESQQNILKSNFSKPSKDNISNIAMKSDVKRIFDQDLN
mgnify:CR=1 FL=1